MQWNKEHSQQKLSPIYESSDLNPAQAEKNRPGCGAWYAAIQAEIASGYEDACLGKEELVRAKEQLKISAEAIFSGNETPEEKAAKAQALWNTYLCDSAKIRAFDFVKGRMRKSHWQKARALEAHTLMQAGTLPSSLCLFNRSQGRNLP